MYADVNVSCWWYGGTLAQHSGGIPYIKDVATELYISWRNVLYYLLYAYMGEWAYSYIIRNESLKKYCMKRITHRICPLSASASSLTRFSLPEKYEKILNNSKNTVFYYFIVQKV